MNILCINFKTSVGKVPVRSVDVHMTGQAKLFPQKWQCYIKMKFVSSLLFANIAFESFTLHVHFQYASLDESQT